MICNHCGKELSQEAIDANKCPYCGYIIHESINEIENNSSISANNSNIEKDYSENTIGNIIYGMGMLVLIIGTIGSIYFSADEYDRFSIYSFVIYEFATILSGFILIGFSQIIQLLHKIHEKIK